MSSFHPDTIHLGLDVHKDSISAGILNPGHESADVEKIFNDEESVLASSGASAIRAWCGPATRPGRRAMTCTGCWPRWGCAAM